MIYKFRYGRPHSLENTYILFSSFYNPFDACQYGVYGILLKKVQEKQLFPAFKNIKGAKIGTELWYRNGQWEYAV